MRQRVRGRKAVPVMARFLRQAERQDSPAHDLVIGQEVTGYRPAVQGDIGNIGVLRMVRLDGQGLAVPQADDRLPEERCDELVLAGAGAHRVQAQGRQDVPGSHLAAVLVAADAVRSRGIHRGQDGPDRFLRPGRSADPVEQEGHLLAGLVAMGILAHDTADIGMKFLLAGRRIGEERIQCAVQRIAAAQERFQARHVMRDEETVMPGRRLRVIPGPGERVEGLRPVAVRLLAAEETRIRVEQGAPTQRTGVVFRRYVTVSQRFRHPGDAPVVIAEFQRLGDGFHFEVGRDVPVGVVEFRCIRIALVGGDDHGLQGLLAVEIPDPAEPGIRDDRYAMVADHAVRLVAGQGPDGQFSPAVVIVQHAVHHVRDKGRGQDGLERMPGAEGIPDGQGRVEMPSFRKLPVAGGFVPIAAVDVVQAVGRQERVIEIRVKDIGRSAFHLDGAERLGPAGLGRGKGLVKVETDAVRLRQPVRPRPFRGHAGNAGKDGNLLGLRRERQQQHARLRSGFIHDRGGKDGAQIDIPVVSPAVHPAGSRHLPAHLVDIDADRRAPSAHAMVRIDPDHPGAGAGESVAVHPHMRKGREFRRNPPLRERNLVIARRARFAVMRERKGRHAVDARSHQEVPKVRTARPREVRMAESEDTAVRIMITGAIIHIGIGAQLDSPVRDGCAGIGVPGVIRSSEDIYKTGGLPVPCTGNESQRQCQADDGPATHGRASRKGDCRTRIPLR